MNNGWARKVVALLLAVFVTAGLSLSAVQAASMVGKMAMASGMGASGHGDCQGCPGDAPDDSGKAMACANVCVVPVVALPSVPAAPTDLIAKLVSFPVQESLLDGTTLTPDPHPPRTTGIG
jgi:hypothetical protein